jgi:tetratricopeptide (TPR) repeat protein
VPKCRRPLHKSAALRTRQRFSARAVEYFAHAGDNASARLDPAQACEQFTHAMELSEKLPGDARVPVQIALYRKLGDANLSRGLAANAERDYNAALSCARAAGDAEAECRALTDLANVHIYTRKPEAMAECAEKAIRVAERIGHERLLCEAKGQLAASYQVIGRVEEAHRLYDQSIPAARSLNHTPALLQALTYRGVAHFFRTEYDKAVIAEGEAVQLASETRNGFYLALAHTYLGYSLANQGRISEALDSLNQALALGQRNENRIVLSRAPNGIGWIYREIGNFKLAIEYDEACVETAEKAGATEAVANALINLVYDYKAVEEWAKAHHAMRRVDSLYDRDLWNRWRFYDVRQQAAAAEYWMGVGDFDHAEQHARLLLANAERYGVPKYIAVACRVLGEIAALRGDIDTAEEEFTSASRILELNPAPLVEWRIRAAMGRCLRGTASRPAAARKAFQSAVKVVGNIAENITDADCRASFLDSEDVRMVISGASESSARSWA